MNICPNCLKAQTSHTHGGYTAGCEGCNIRGIANSPKHVREHFYQTLLVNQGAEQMAKTKAAVTAEWKRIQRLKEREE